MMKYESMAAIEAMRSLRGDGISKHISSALGAILDELPDESTIEASLAKVLPEGAWSTADYRVGTQTYKDIHINQAGPLVMNAVVHYLQKDGSSSHLEEMMRHAHSALEKYDDLKNMTLHFTLRMSGGDGPMERVVVGFDKDVVELQYAPNSKEISSISYRSPKAEFTYRTFPAAAAAAATPQ